MGRAPVCPFPLPRVRPGTFPSGLKNSKNAREKPDVFHPARRRPSYLFLNVSCKSGHYFPILQAAWSQWRSSSSPQKVRWNFSASSLRTFGETTPGASGQMDVLNPQIQQRKQNADRLLLIPREHQGQGQVVHPAAERLRQGGGHFDRTIGVVALAHVHDPRETADISKVQIVKAELPHANVRTMLSAGVCFTKSV